MMHKLLGILSPVDKVLQSRSSDLRLAMEVVDTVQEKLSELRFDFD